MKILAIEREAPGANREDCAPLLKAEAERVWELQTSGVIREIYFRSDRRDAVLMLECSGIEEANAILSTLPLAKAGSIIFEIIPLSAYTGFSRLFAENTTKDDDSIEP